MGASSTGHGFEAEYGDDAGNDDAGNDDDVRREPAELLLSLAILV